jgi:hypothetical protein
MKALDASIEGLSRRLKVRRLSGVSNPVSLKLNPFSAFLEDGLALAHFARV